MIFLLAKYNKIGDGKSINKMYDDPFLIPEKNWVSNDIAIPMYSTIYKNTIIGFTCRDTIILISKLREDTINKILND
jgi:hypothetical protein